MSVVEEMDDTEDPGISLKVSYLNFNKYEFIFHRFTICLHTCFVNSTHLYFVLSLYLLMHSWLEKTKKVQANIF